MSIVSGTIVFSVTKTETWLELSEEKLFEDMGTKKKGHDFANSKEVYCIFLFPPPCFCWRNWPATMYESGIRLIHVSKT
jgi:hypothetical protein